MQLHPLTHSNDALVGSVCNKIILSFQGKYVFDTPRRTFTGGSKMEASKKQLFKKSLSFHNEPQTPRRRTSLKLKKKPSTDQEEDQKNEQNSTESDISKELEDSFDIIHLNNDLDRPKTAFEIMMSNSKVTAVGRRMFNEDEILGKSSQSGKSNENGMKTIESRYMNVFDKRPENIKESYEQIIQQPRDLGFWDDVVNPENFVCNKKVVKKSPKKSFEEKLRIAQKEAEKKDIFEVSEKVIKPEAKVTLKNHSPTGEGK